MKRHLLLIFIGALFFPLLANGGVCGTSETFESLGDKNPIQWCYGLYPADSCNNHIADFCLNNYHYHIRCNYDNMGLGCQCSDEDSFRDYCENGCENKACKTGGQTPGTGLCSSKLSSLGNKSPADWCLNIYDCYSDGRTDVCEGNTLYRIRCVNDPQSSLCLCSESISDIVNCTAGCENGACLEPEDLPCKWIRDSYCGGGDCEPYKVQDICGPSGCDPAKSESECNVPGENRCMDREDCLQAVQDCDDSNNIIEEREQCSGTNLDGKDCSDFVFTEGTLLCEDCVFDVSKCSGYIGGVDGEENGGNGSNGGSNGGSSISVTLDNPLNATSVTALIDGLINFIFYLGLAIAPIMFLVGGFLFMTSSGDSAKVTKGKSVMLYTAIGLAIVIAAKGLVLVLKDILGVKEDPVTYFKNLLVFGMISKEFLFQKIKTVKKSLKVGRNQ